MPAECGAVFGKDDWNLKIIIVGDGKVGYALAEHLSQEEHDVTVIDTNDDALRRASEALDVLCVKGNGPSLSALREARRGARPWCFPRPAWMRSTWSARWPQ